MGVNLKDLIRSKDLKMSQLANKKLGIDGYNWAYQFISIIRLPDGSPLTDSKGRVTSHLTGIFNRTMSLLREGIKPCYVWDGEPPKMKQKELKSRARRKEAAKKALKKAKTKKSKMKWAQQTAKLTKEMVADAEKLLDAMGVPSIQAPSEGEAEIAYLTRQGVLDSCASQDWDSLLFGAPQLIRNLSIGRKKKVPGKSIYVKVKPQVINLKENLKKLGITREQLVIMGMLIGTDYSSGVRGYGPKKSYKVVKEQKELDKVLEVTGWEDDTDPQKVMDIFMKPKVEKVIPQWKPLDPEKVMKVLVDDFEFKADRIESQLKKYEESKGQRGQTGLGKFF